MSSNIKHKQEVTKRRAQRTRARISGTKERPRLTVKRSAKHIYAQLIDDTVGRTLASASDKEATAGGKPVDTAKQVGEALAKKAVAIGIQSAVFDRGGYRYHGRVAALADGARNGGLTF